MNKRRKQQLLRDGINPELIEKLTLTFLKEMQNTGLTLQEAKIVTKKMACILTGSEKHRPETLIKEINLNTLYKEKDRC